MPAKLESLGPRSTDGPLRTAVAKAIILPLWELRGIDQLESYDFVAERKRLKSQDLVSDKQTAQWAFAASSPP